MKHLFLMILLLSNITHACFGTYSSNFSENIDQHFLEADVVFVGIVSKIEKQDDEFLPVSGESGKKVKVLKEAVTFQPQGYIKGFGGMLPKNPVVYVSKIVACKEDFEIGRSYVVFASSTLVSGLPQLRVSYYSSGSVKNTGTIRLLKGSEIHSL